jgi:hypothetical protein
MCWDAMVDCAHLYALLMLLDARGHTAACSCSEPVHVAIAPCGQVIFSTRNVLCKNAESARTKAGIIPWPLFMLSLVCSCHWRCQQHGPLPSRSFAHRRAQQLSPCGFCAVHTLCSSKAADGRLRNVARPQASASTMYPPSKTIAMKGACRQVRGMPEQVGGGGSSWLVLQKRAGCSFIINPQHHRCDPLTQRSISRSYSPAGSSRRSATPHAAVRTTTPIPIRW